MSMVLACFNSGVGWSSREFISQLLQTLFLSERDMRHLAEDLSQYLCGMGYENISVTVLRILRIFLIVILG